jgi:SAM-dependent methyltransferase
METVRPGVIADLGCGDGAVLRALARRGLLGDETFAVDLSPERVQVAARTVPGVKPLVADAANVDALDDGVLDGVIVSQVIEHLPDDRALATEIARLLRPGGWWYVGTVLRGPRAWWFYRIEGVRRLDPTHIREYESEAELRRALDNEALSVDRVRIAPLRYPLSDLALRAFGKAGLLGADQLRGAYRSPLLKRLRNLPLPVPGYRLVEVSGRKRDPVSSGAR